ncbi:MAG: hypothetical protein FJX25_09940 [Alphaproteobacteria bacterium]|nr:hypothetical protein [Alphaproteobacteria bacterium]
MTSDPRELDLEECAQVSGGAMATTLAIGEEDGGWNRRLTTMALGEEEPGGLTRFPLDGALHTKAAEGA